MSVRFTSHDAAWFFILVCAKGGFDEMIAFIYDASASVQEHVESALEQIPFIRRAIIVSRPSVA
jgi:hypothetical protein